MLRFFTPALPRPPILRLLLAGGGGALAIALLALGGAGLDLPLLIAPFGASCVLLFAAPSAPLSQPVNVIGGHVVATAIGLLLHLALPDSWWAQALAVGLAIAAMGLLRVTHPPAGADPLLVFAMGPSVSFLILPVLAGATALVMTAVVFHRISGTPYPVEQS